MDALKQGVNVLFILLGGSVVLAMHAWFAFLEIGTARKKNQINTLVKILVGLSVSTAVFRRFWAATAGVNFQGVKPGVRACGRPSMPTAASRTYPAGVAGRAECRSENFIPHFADNE